MQAEDLMKLEIIGAFAQGYKLYAYWLCRIREWPARQGEAVNSIGDPERIRSAERVFRREIIDKAVIGKWKYRILRLVWWKWKEASPGILVKR